MPRPFELENNTSVYIHRRVSDGRIFYVGITKTSTRKRRQNRRDGRNQIWRRIADKHGYSSEVIVSGITWESACEIERWMIASYGKIKDGGVLANIADGGEGAAGVFGRVAWNRGLKTGPCSEIHKLRMKQAFTPERKRFMSLLQRNRIAQNGHHFQGKKLCEQHVDKLRAAKTGKKISPAQLQGIIRSRVKLMKPVVVRKNGVLIGSFKSHSACSEALGVNEMKILRYKNTNKTTKDGYEFSSF